MIGIENIKKAAKAVIKFGVKLQEALEDGKFTMLEGISIAIGSAPDAFELATNAQELKAEIQDLTKDEVVELVDYVVDELNLDNENVLEIIEAGVELLVALDNLRLAIKKD